MSEGKTDTTVDFKQVAKKIFEEQVFSGSSAIQQATYRNHNKLEPNLWRVSWAMDSILDYMTEINTDVAPQSSYYDLLGSYLLNHLLNPLGGNWWDDYGWTGIVSLKAAVSGLFNEQASQAFMQRAINCFCYMYGPGWKGDGTPTAQNFVLPYPNDFGGKWTETIDYMKANTAGGFYGASFVYKYAKESYTYYYNSGGTTAAHKVSNVQPPFDYQGIWNNNLGNSLRPGKGSGPIPVTAIKKDNVPNLCGIQNTVTNALFTLFSLRLYQASQKEQWTRVFSVLNGSRFILEFWKNQMGWWANWFDKAADHGLESTWKSLGLDGGLVQERVSGFVNTSGDSPVPMFDASFVPGLAWTGDQGLLLSAFREAFEYSGSDQEIKKTAGKYKDILYAVMIYAYDEFSDPEGGGSKQNSTDHLESPLKYLRPWLVITGDEGSYQANFDGFPQGDNADYQTGNAVFYRALLDIYKSQPDTLSLWKDRIIASATYLADNYNKNGTLPNMGYSCNPFADADGIGSNALTPWINALGLLTMAEAMKS